MFDDAQLNEIFKNTNFGVVNTAANYRLILKNALLKTAVGYHNGHTITQIMIGLGLISGKSLRVLKSGQQYLREVQHDYEMMVKSSFEVANKETATTQLKEELQASNG
jgi:hypothetical protein